MAIWPWLFDERQLVIKMEREALTHTLDDVPNGLSGVLCNFIYTHANLIPHYKWMAKKCFTHAEMKVKSCAYINM